jgi:hypothetical protein
MPPVRFTACKGGIEFILKLAMNRLRDRTRTSQIDIDSAAIILAFDFGRWGRVTHVDQ